MKKLLFILTTIILLTGCTPVLKIAYGIKNPQLTTTEKTKDFLNKKNIEGKDIYFKVFRKKLYRLNTKLL